MGTFWTKKPPTRVGWYWRVARGEKPKPYAVSREDSPDYSKPIITVTGPEMDCETVEEDGDFVLWSSKPIAPPAAPKWPDLPEPTP